jgi:hypothetical protein
MLAAAAVTAPARRGVAARSCGAELRRASGARVFRRMWLSALDSSETLRQRRLSVPLRDTPGRPCAVSLPPLAGAQAVPAAGTALAGRPSRRDVRRGPQPPGRSPWPPAAGTFAVAPGRRDVF